ncbi:Helicase associated domain protein [Nocardia terpenica]|nr:Helicase associated domain protein [Nocardia terpenica]
MELRPYQRDAVAAITAALASGGITQLHAACGSGKTLIAAHCAGLLVDDGGLTVVFVPSIALAAQTICVMQTVKPSCRVMAVCHDDSVVDAPMTTADLKIAVSTEPAVIADWLTEHEGTLLVSTYQSADRTAEALRICGLRADLLILDEAHHLTGNAESVIRRITAPSFVPAVRRLYMTATPRAEEVRGVTTGQLLSMDDSSVFGTVAYTYPFARAINEKYLKDYRILIIGIRDSQARRLLARADTAYVARFGAPELRTVVAQAALAKAARQYGLTRTIAFTHRVAAAAEFARTLPALVRQLPEDQCPRGDLLSRYVSGEQTLAVRDKVLEHLRTPPASGWTVIANARCLGEGVDVPAVDSVIFTHPKHSSVDIVQAVGRALRACAGTTDVATIILPIFVADEDEADGDLDAGDYATLWRVVCALRAHDECLGIELDKQRTGRSNGTVELPDKITIQLPDGTSERVVQQLSLLMVKHTSDSFWTGYGHLRRYCAAHGHPHVHRDYTAADGFRLGWWCHKRRQDIRRGHLQQRYVALLRDLGFEPEPRAARYQAGFAAAKAFHTQYGHLNVPYSFIMADGFRLGAWISTQRPGFRNATLSPERMRDLAELGMRARGAAVRLGRSVADVAPHLIDEWDATANPGLSPHDVPANSQRSVGWICRHGHRWRTRPGTRIKGGSGCHRCTHLPPPGRSLADLHPDIAAQLAADLNDGATADELGPRSGRRVWWRCEHGHTWQAPVQRRTTRKTGCPDCRSNRRARHSPRELVGRERETIL